MNDFEKYAYEILKMTRIESVSDFPSCFCLSSEADLSIYYAPFDYINSQAKVCICGITPGLQQASLALAEAQKQLLLGSTLEESWKCAKETASFGGSMRNNLVAMLNHVGIDRVLGIESCARLFSADSGLIHFTSALRYPVFLNGKNYSGNPSMIRNKLLRQQIERYLTEEIRALSADCLYIPLGPKVAEVFEYLSKNGVLSSERVLSGLPHPSGANNERISYFLGKKDRELLSSKTNPEQIDFARTEIMQKVSAHRA